MPLTKDKSAVTEVARPSIGGVQGERGIRYRVGKFCVSPAGVGVLGAC